MVTVNYLLNDYRYRVKRIHGKDTCKYIKFDEAAYSLVLELKLSGDSSWLRITPSLARELKNEYETDDIKRARDRLTAKLLAEPPDNPNWIPLVHGRLPPA